MDTIRVVSGTGTGPTATAAYDAALLDAGVGNYNLVVVSSVLPAEATVERPGTAPSLGAIGDRLTVVQARAVGDRAGAALAWGHTPGGEGLFYEGNTRDAGDDPRERALREAEQGLTAGFDARDWSLVDRTSTGVAATSPERIEDSHAAAVVLAVYGDGTSPF
jgi:arginine decarboxylase (EC 4.1.1.19)